VTVEEESDGAVALPGTGDSGGGWLLWLGSGVPQDYINACGTRVKGDGG
jgi:hypothetical protein